MIGLLLGTENKTERFHPPGLTALATEKFGSAVHQMARYKQLSCPEEILQQRDDKGWSIRFPRLLADEVEPKALIEWCFGRVFSAACHYLNDSVLELNEGAYLLGEEDANTFVRAFRTAEGVPPACGREKQRSKAAS